MILEGSFPPAVDVFFYEVSLLSVMITVLHLSPFYLTSESVVLFAQVLNKKIKLAFYNRV